MARRPTPTQILKLRGSWRAETRDGEPKTSPELPDAPDWLCDLGKEYWKSWGAQLLGMGVMAEIHSAALATACDLMAEYRKLSTDHNPLSKADKLKVYDRLIKALSHLGMTPSSITTVRAEKKAKAKFPSLKLA